MSGWPSVRSRTAVRPPRRLPGVTYVRCHDDIGWAVSDADAAAAGIDGFAHRRFLSDFYAGRLNCWHRQA